MGKRAANPKEAPQPKKTKTAADQATCSVDRPAMDKLEISKMLGSLKYFARAVKASPEDKKEAETALTTYSALDSHKKRDFLEAFQKNKGSLKWVSSFTSQSREEEKTKAARLCVRTHARAHVRTHVRKYEEGYMDIIHCMRKSIWTSCTFGLRTHARAHVRTLGRHR